MEGKRRCRRDWNRALPPIVLTAYLGPPDHVRTGYRTCISRRSSHEARPDERAEARLADGKINSGFPCQGGRLALRRHGPRGVQRRSRAHAFRPAHSVLVRDSSSLVFRAEAGAEATNFPPFASLRRRLMPDGMHASSKQTRGRSHTWSREPPGREAVPLLPA